MHARPCRLPVLLLGASLVTAAAAPRLTPPPSAAVMQPTPAAADSYEAEVVAGLPAYQPEQSVSGIIRVWGHGNRKLPWMHHLVDLWQQAFQRFHPGIRFDYQMHGTSSGIPALFTGVGDVAILGEEMLPQAVAAFERAKGYPPLGLEIATGSLDVRNFDYAQMVFVHRDNPLQQITLAQLDGVFGEEHRRGDRLLRRWNDLGLDGRWKDRAIVPYGWAIDDSFGFFIQQAVLEGSHRWNRDLREHIHITYPDGSIHDHGQQILDALAADRDGIALSNIRYAGADVKALGLGRSETGPFVQASKRSLIDQIYPLARTIPAVIDSPPGMPIDPKVREFLRFLLSRDGQQQIIADGRYLPLHARVLAEQRRKLP